MKSFSIKNLLNASMIALVIGVVIEIVALALYAATGVNEFSETLSQEVIGFGIAAICLGLILVVLRVFSVDGIKLINSMFDSLIAVSFILSLFAMIFYVTSQVNYLANVFVGIDGTSISPTFVISVAAFILASAAIVVSSFAYKRISKEGDK